MKATQIRKYLPFIALFSLLYCSAIAQPKKLIHFWDFNNTIPLSGIGDIGGNGDSLGSLGTPPHHLPSNYSTLAGGAKITYTRPHHVPQIDSVLDNDISGSFIYDFSSSNYLYYHVSDSAAAAALCGCSGNLCVRTRNPSLNSYMYMYVPTTGYMNINLSFALSATSNKGAQYNIFSYSTNNGVTWNPLTAAMDTFTIGGGIRHPDTLLANNVITAARVWMPVNIDFSSAGAANNNAGFIIRFFSAGSNASLTTGSDRYDNISIRGDSVCPVIWQEPLNKNVCSGTNTCFVTGIAGGLTNSIQWQVNTGSGFANVTNGGVYNGATTDSLSITNIPLGMSGYTYRCVIICAPCNNDTSTVATLTVKPSPTVTATASKDTICQGSNVTLTGNGAVTYSWTGGATNAVAFAPPSTLTYTVTGTAANGCTDTANITVHVNNAPPVTANANHDTVCAGNSVTLNGGGANTYVWSGGVTNGVAFTPAATQTYTVTGSDPIGCTNTATIQVVVNPIPVVNVTPNASNICYGNNVVLTATGTNSYSWSPPTGLSCTACPNPTASPLVTTTYKVVGTSLAGCADSANVTVTVAPQIPAAITGIDTICSGTSTTLTASGGGTYLWSTGSTNTAITISPLSNCTYSVLVTVGSCTDSAKVNVVVNASPIVSVTGNNSICIGSNTTLTATGGGTYLWNTGSTTSSINVSPATTTTYTAAVSNVHCTVDSTITVTVHPYPVVTITPPQSICPGDTATIATTGGGTYAWNNSATSGTVKVTPATTTNYTVAVSNGFCITDTNTKVTVNPAPVPSLTGNAAVCSGDSTMLTAGGGISYTWNTGSTTTTIKVAPPVTTGYTVQVSNGLCTKDTNLTVIVTPTPVPIVSTTQIICLGGSSNLLAAGSSSYSWVPVNNLSNSSIANPIASPTTTTTYTVKESNGVCTANDSVKVIVNPLPAVAASPNVNIVITESTPLAIAPTPPGDTYIWSPSDGLSCTDCPNPIADPLVTTTYYVTTTDANGCSTTDTVEVSVKDDCGYLFVPNAFSPNGDGHNDVLLVYGVCITKMTFIVFDRWGKQLFESTEQSMGWDGTFNGQKMNPDTYTYYLGVTLIDGTKVVKSGNVALVR